jgi:DNA-binding response OmpR family regulator
MSVSVVHFGSDVGSDRKTILVASPSPLTGEYVAEILRRAGYKVDIVSDNVTWTDIPLTGLLAAILIGSNLQWLEYACSAIRHRASKLTIMILGPNDLTSSTRLFDVGADGYLFQSVAPEELLARIACLTRMRPTPSQGHHA